MPDPTPTESEKKEESQAQPIDIGDIPTEEELNNMSKDELQKLADRMTNPKREDPGPDETRKGCVYFYYFPTYKEIANLKSENRWQFKIGYNETDDPQGRVDDQVTGMPEKPEIEARMYTEAPRHLEQIIHAYLKKQGMYIADAPGKEWFLLSPDIVKRIVEAVKVFQKSLDFQSSTQ